MRLLFSVWTIIAFILASLLMGCASGVGINRHEFFELGAPVVLPVKIIIDDSTRSAESSLSMGKDATIQAFMVSGVVGAAMTNSPKAIGAIRGSYQVGKVIEEVAASMSKLKDPEGTILFHLDRFQYAGDRGRLQTMMAFKTSTDGENKLTHSVYACDMGIPFSIIGFPPEMEKDMLREMVEHVLSHWRQNLSTQFVSNADGLQRDIEFPSASRGRFSGRNVDCVYDIFARHDN